MDCGGLSWVRAGRIGAQVPLRPKRPQRLSRRKLILAGRWSPLNRIMTFLFPMSSSAVSRALRFLRSRGDNAQRIQMRVKVSGRTGHDMKPSRPDARAATVTPDA
jgi:hypothetical protein